MNIYTLVEITSSGTENYEYGYIVCKNKDVTIEMLQEQIFNIKNLFGEKAEQDGYDFTIEELVEYLPTKWKCKYIQSTKKLYV